MALSLADAAAKGSALSGRSVQRLGSGRFKLTGDSSSSQSSGVLSIDLNATQHSIGHFLAGAASKSTLPAEMEKKQELQRNDLQTLQGEWQKAEKPWLANSSEIEMEHTAKWIDARSKSTAPWVFRARISGGALPAGHWCVVSSQAFLVLPLEVFVLLSAGFLHPILREASLRILGVPDSWPPPLDVDSGRRSSSSHSPSLSHEESDSSEDAREESKYEEEEDDDQHHFDEEDEEAADAQGEPMACSNSVRAAKVRCSRSTRMLWDIFLTLEPYLSTSQQGTIAWVPASGPTIRFTKQGAAWHAAKQDVFSSGSLLFFFALGLNFAASASMATFLVYMLKRYMLSVSRFQDEAVATTSSQRTTNCEKVDRSWKILAVQANIPDHVVVLRWRLRTGSDRATYFSIFAESEPEVGKSEEPHEVYIEKVLADKIMPVSSTIITEFKWSISGDVGFGYNPIGRLKSLHYQRCYRFQVYAYDSEDVSVGNSAWSNGVVIMPPCSIFEVPFMLLKSYFPVPTSSLGYFVDHFASFLIQGVIPQHIVVLSELKVVYHKNFRDFHGREGPFFLTAYMGEDTQVCERLTRSGRCSTYAKTENFTPPRLCTLAEEFLTEEDEELLRKDDQLIESGEDSKERAQELGPQVLRVGSTDRQCNSVWISMRWESNEEDVAEAKVDFEDFMEAFEEIFRDNEAEDETIFFDLKTDTKADFDEDYLVWVQARVSFENSVDQKCVSLPKDRRLFQKDAPGQIFYEGMERFVSWGKENELVSGITAFDLYVTYPEYSHLEPRLLVRDVQTSSVGVTFMVDFPAEVKECYVTAQLIVDPNREGSPPPLSSDTITSHRFVICRTWTLSDFELAYASFCKMNDMPMERLNEESLNKYKLSTTKVQLKVVPDLRPALPFERLGQNEYISCPGMSRIGNSNVYTNDTEEALDADELAANAGGSDAGGSKHGGSAPSAGRAASLNRGTTASSGGGSGAGSEAGGRAGLGGGTTAPEQRSVYRPTSQDVVVLEHVWPRMPGQLSCLYGTGWVPSALLLHGFYPVDNILEYLVMLAEITRLTSIYTVSQQLLGAHISDRLLALLVAPVTWFLPYFAEGLLYAMQLLVFLLFPGFLFAVALLFEYLTSLLGERGTFEGHSFLLDAAFGHTISGIDMKSWTSSLLPTSRVVLLIGLSTLLLQIVLIFEANFIRRTLPSYLQRFAHDSCNGLAVIIVRGYVWLFLFLTSMTALWFLMAVVIYPEQMLTPLACLIGMILVLHAMFSRYASLRAQVISFLRAEVPEALSLVCENFLDAYEKTKVSQNKFMERNYLKQEELTWKSLALYYKNRLTGFAQNADHFKSLFDKDVDDSYVQRVFNRALLKERNWERLLAEENMQLGTPQDRSAMVKEPSSNVQILLPQTPAEVANTAADLSGLKTTRRVLHDLGMGHDDSSQAQLDLRVRIIDRETEAGGEAVHLYDKTLRDQLMRVFVRIQEDLQPLPRDVMHVLQDPKLLARAIVRAHRSKMKVVDPSQSRQGQAQDGGSDTCTLLQLFVQDVQHQKMKRMYFYLAEHLDLALDPQVISSKATPFNEKQMPDEIAKHLRLTLDENKVGSPMQLLFEDLRRWKGSQSSEKALQAHLVLKQQGDHGGLMEVLTKLGVIDKHATMQGYKVAFYRRIERSVRHWKSEESSSNALDPELLEEFVRELVNGYVWWGALRSLFHKLGFPMLPRDAPPQPDMLSEADVMREFESKSMKDGLLPVSSILDFICDLTRAGRVEGAAGRIWKSQMMLLMQNIGICGFLQNDRDLERSKQRRSREVANTDASEEDAARASGASLLSGLSKRQWPQWLEELWRQSAPEWRPLVETRHTPPKGQGPRPFLPKAALHMFMRSVAFSVEKDAGEARELELKEIDQVYDNWKVSTSPDVPTSVWCKRSKVHLQLRGIWHECFLELLDKMDNGVKDKLAGIDLFEQALKKQQEWSSRDGGQGRYAHEGLLDFEFFENCWLKEQMENNTECSLQVFKEALIMAEITIPDVVVDALWFAADKDKCNHPSLRKILDLEDRLVMYLSKGLCFESARILVYDELQSPTMQTRSLEAIRTAFRQVDDKTGQVGFIEPREVNEMLLLLAQDGVSLSTLQQGFRKLKISIPDDIVKAAFLMMDTNSDDVIDMPEFLGMIDYFIDALLPEQVFRALGMSPQQVVSALLLTGLAFAIILLFVFVSMGAFQVQVSDAASSTGSSMIRAGIAVVAALGLRRDTSEEDLDKRFGAVREQLYGMMGVTQSQLEARRRASVSGLSGVTSASQSGANSSARMRLARGGQRSSADEDDDDDGGDDS
eukprot:TRINITY_DN3084_c0_g7_i1.p1 TRINITY_DN3084_c0_g7~~TRINITY_DN3084_c0_g7_i1.p1  ORF type:complete len:2646 (-),score=570.29 TRINITY_DN3084_c0_g7_i1:479-7402(-)